MLNIKKVDATRVIANVQKELDTQTQLIHAKERELILREADIKKLNDEISAIKRAGDAEKRRFDPTKDLPTLQQDVARKYKELRTKENELARIELEIKNILQELQANDLKQKALDAEINKRSTELNNIKVEKPTAKSVVVEPKADVQKNKKLLEEKKVTEKGLDDENLKIQQELEKRNITKKSLAEDILKLQQLLEGKKNVAKNLDEENLKWQQELSTKGSMAKKITAEIPALQLTVEAEAEQYTQSVKTSAVAKDTQIKEAISLQQTIARKNQELQHKENELPGIRLAIQKGTQSLHTLQTKVESLNVELKEKNTEYEKSQEKVKNAKTNRNQPDIKDKARQKEIAEKESLKSKEAIIIPALKREILELRANQVRKRDELSRLQRA